LNDLNGSLSMRDNITQNDIKRSFESLSHGEIGVGHFMHTRDEVSPCRHSEFALELVSSDISTFCLLINFNSRQLVIQCGHIVYSSLSPLVCMNSPIGITFLLIKLTHTANRSSRIDFDSWMSEGLGQTFWNPRCLKVTGDIPQLRQELQKATNAYFVIFTEINQEIVNEPNNQTTYFWYFAIIVAFIASPNWFQNCHWQSKNCDIMFRLAILAIDRTNNELANMCNDNSPSS
jgi:hypothetical protein